MAAEFGHLDTLKVLLDAGADINAQSKVQRLCAYGMTIENNSSID